MKNRNLVLDRNSPIMDNLKLQFLAVLVLGTLSLEMVLIKKGFMFHISLIRYQIILTQCTVATFSYLETPIYFIGCLPFLTPLGRDSTITGLLDDFVKPILQKRSKLLLSCALKLSQLRPAASSSDAKAL